MLNPWLLLGTIAFAVSFGISLLTTRDVGGSLVAGATTTAIAWVTAAAVNWYHNRSADSRVANLKSQIRSLQRRRAEEYQAVLEMFDEKERVALALNSMQTRLRQLQLPGAAPPSANGLSWDLLSPVIAEPTIDVTPYEFSPPPPALSAHETSLNQFLTEAAATKQKITASLNNLQAELSQLNAQISEHRQLRDQLTQEIQTLTQQKQKLTTTAKNLRSEVEELERYRIELDQYMSYVEAKKQELETGSNPLQKVLKQLQEQVNALQMELQHLENQVTVRRGEKEKLDREMAGLKQQQDQHKPLREDLQKLENQVSDRKQEKDSLERYIVQLQAQKTALRNQPTPPRTAQASLPTLNRPSKPSDKSASPGDPSRPSATPKALRVSTATDSSVKPAPDSPNGKTAASANHSAQEVVSPPKQPISASNDNPEQSSQELSELWTDFMVQLPEYEFQTLKAIAHESHPVQIVNKIAEDSLTTPEELIDSINQRAQETIGERVIKPRSGFSPPAIAREHLRTIKKLIETYEYLTE